ncbi:hypothetical protein BUALT_Bualt15G0040200 [Buddleja alternifolia]|uniref:Uncharacterized protein n=1 Tax=Buddleja alternifolia TaxID=168488 RepID=A0AAV6WLJ1_9LAMI|nr:hypothetical protein BUALT_Bualt15G0040200 [Buddleja alternifolia]
MSASVGVNFTLKVVINKEENKVLFAEVDGNFADVLITVMTLPLGTIVRLLANHFADQAPRIGSLSTLYQGLSNLESRHFCSATGKQILLNARNSLAPLCKELKLNLDDSKPTKCFICGEWCYDVVMNRDDLKCKYEDLFREIILKSSKIKPADNSGGVFTKETATFLITDDLQVVPNLAGVCIQILNNLGIRDTNELEERTVPVGLKEIMELLKASLFSRTPLTDVIMHKSRVDSTNIVISQLRSSLPHITEDSTTKKMILKAIIRKSTNKVLLAQADEDFIDFLFSLLTIPLGRAVCLLGSNTCLGSADNLYRSIANLDTERYLNTENLKSALLKPQLPPEYLSKNQIFSHTEVMSNHYNGSNMNFVDLNRKSGYVKGPAMFMVTDDLVVTPSSAISSLSLIKNLKIPFSDVEELRFEIGMEEALNILKSSFTSTSALTDGLKPILKRQLKQEK